MTHCHHWEAISTPCYWCEDRNAPARMSVHEGHIPPISIWRVHQSTLVRRSGIGFSWCCKIGVEDLNGVWAEGATRLEDVFGRDWFHEQNIV